MTGKTIRIFLADGAPNGVLTALHAGLDSIATEAEA
jgi:hypothetical protein